MKYALNLAEDNRILSVWVVFSHGVYDGMPIVEEQPEGDITEYRYIDGQYVRDPLPNPDPVEPEEPVSDESVWDELDAAYRRGVDSV